MGFYNSILGSNTSIHSYLFTIGRQFLKFLISEFLRHSTAAIIVLIFQWNWGSLYQWANNDAAVTIWDPRLEAVTPPYNVTEMFDFASIDAGGYHLPALTSHGPSSHRSPDLALTPSLDEGHCWLLPHVAGYLGVSLPSPIIVTHFTIDHAPMTPSGTSQRSDAPRSMILWGLIEGQTNFGRYQSHPRIHGLSHTTPAPEVVRASKENNPSSFFIELGHLQYHQGDGAPHSQTFSVHEDMIEASLDYGIVVLEIRGNWGGDHTCLYRFRVHGQKVET